MDHTEIDRKGREKEMCESDKLADIIIAEAESVKNDRAECVKRLYRINGVEPEQCRGTVSELLSSARVR